MSDDDKTNILIVDDLPEKLLAYQTVLEGLGQNLVTVRSGTAALKQVLKMDFAVILLDVQMPDMDGFETAQLIRKRKRSAYTPIIFLTAFADEVRTTQGYATGAVDYISTPVVPEILQAKVRVFVELFRMRRQVARQAEEQARREATEEANQRLSFLARAGAILGRSLDYEATARDVVQLAVPALADLSVVCLSEPSGTGGQLIVARAEEQEEPFLDGKAGRESAPEELRAVIDQVLKSGTRELLRKQAEGSNEVLTTGVVLPLQARDRIFGALALSREPSGRSYAPADLTMADAFTSRAAPALHNALLHGEIQKADRQKNEFLSMLAHELRNPLAPISSAVQVMRLSGPDEDDLPWALDVIERQVGQLVRLVDDLLDIARITRGKIQLRAAPVDVESVISQALEASRPLIEARKHQLSVDLPEEALWVQGDSARLIQVLTNLLNNAAKYTEEGGRVWLAARREGDTLALSVRDSGVGIPAHMLSAVFDLFAQADRTLDRSQGGLGIGLTLVRRLVEMHGGTVQAASEGPQRGAEFVVRLPLLVEALRPRAAGGKVPAEGPALALRRVLVVDDNEDAADSLALLVQRAGHEVRVARDGTAGLEAALAFEPNVVLLDIGLPGLNGYEVARRLRDEPRTRDALLIAVSGYGREEDRERSRQAGFDHHLIKPVDMSTLARFLPALAKPEDGRPRLSICG